MDRFLKIAIEEARRGLREGGIPIGSVLVLDGVVLGRGHNRRVQEQSAIRHAEMDCLENAGRLTAREYQRATLYSTFDIRNWSLTSSLYAQQPAACAAARRCCTRFRRSSSARTANSLAVTASW